MVRHSRLLRIEDYPIDQIGDLVRVDPGSAKFHLMLSQAQRDHSVISDRQMAQRERQLKPAAKRRRIMFNPFTGEIRREGIE